MHSNEDSMHKIFSVIEYMSEMGRKLSIQEISASLGVSTATVHRILTGLKDLGYVEQHANKQYYLTCKLYAMSGDVINRDGRIDQLIPVMNYFSMRYGCEVGLTAFLDSAVIQIISVGENLSFGTQFPMPGQRVPAYCTASGKFFLSQMGQKELMEWISTARLVPHTRYTIIDRDALLAEVVRTREKGYGVTEGELYDQIASIAFPVHDKHGDITETINLNFSMENFQRQMSERFVRQVQEALRGFGV